MKPWANASAFPGLGLIRIGTGALFIGSSGAWTDFGQANSAITVADILALSRRNHSIRTGGQVVFYRTDFTTNVNRRGTITFQNFNNFLLGLLNNSLNAEGITTRFLRTADYSLLLQDDWKVSQKLTLNFGVRYELDLPPYETRGAIATFDPALYRPRMEVDASGNPVGPPVAGFVQAGNVIPRYDLPEVPNVGKRIFTSVDPNNFGPRLGFAYSPFESGTLTLRGGYGIFYQQINGETTHAAEAPRRYQAPRPEPAPCPTTTTSSPP